MALDTPDAFIAEWDAVVEQVLNDIDDVTAVLHEAFECHSRSAVSRMTGIARPTLITYADAQQLRAVVEARLRPLGRTEPGDDAASTDRRQPKRRATPEAWRKLDGQITDADGVVHIGHRLGTRWICTCGATGEAGGGLTAAEDHAEHTLRR